MRNRFARIGFQHPVRNIRRLMARRIALTELLMIVALVVCLAVALTAVSLGMARAHTVSAIAENRDGGMALAVFLALLLAGMGGITAVVTQPRGGGRR